MTTRVTLLVQADCGLCDHAKQVLRRVSTDHPLEITEIDATTSEGQHLAARHGIPFTPGILLDGQPFGYGRLSERQLRRTLTRRT